MIPLLYERGLDVRPVVCDTATHFELVLPPYDTVGLGEAISVVSKAPNGLRRVLRLSPRSDDVVLFTTPNDFLPFTFGIAYWPTGFKLTNNIPQGLDTNQTYRIYSGAALWAIGATPGTPSFLNVTIEGYLSEPK